MVGSGVEGEAKQSMTQTKHLNSGGWQMGKHNSRGSNLYLLGPEGAKVRGEEMRNSC